ncbi:hypothetical protein [Altererythrobacter sp.]|uniref:hypothetical protein n=1 Tax=Altererythrobacter sp. TaxID=1872480 RepID=UPI003D085852
MYKLIPSAVLAAAALGLTAVPAIAHDESSSEQSAELTKGEKELAKLLEGRVAGKPTTCIFTAPNENMRVINDTALVYGRGNTIYVNRTRRPQDIDNDDVLVIKRFSGSQLCKLDSVTTLDRSSHMFNGVIFLDDFIPYTRVKDGDDSKG